MSKKKLSIAISYPPLETNKGTAFLSQNRQFQWTNTGNCIYPVIPAYAASLLEREGYQVYWDDAIAEKLSKDQWLKRILELKPDVIAIESKTPTIKWYWQVIDELRTYQTKSWQPTIVLLGDHLTALPQESMDNCSVDLVITGGDYDFMLLNLMNNLDHGETLEPGIWYRDGKTIKNTGPYALKHHNLDSLPFINRDLTKWELYAYNNGNYKYTPATYMMTGRDCWWGKCTFCSWTTIFPGKAFRFFTPKRTLAEVKHVVDNYSIREIFDDAGTLTPGAWIHEFTKGLISSGLHQKVRYGANMRFNAVGEKEYQAMGEARFRFMLYGLESSNQKTLDLLEKGTKTEDARKSLTLAKKYGMEPHLTIMIGYPWETRQDALNTLEEARSLFRDCLADSMQATIVIPYPGTPLFKQCQENNWLLTNDWNDYDMRQAIMKCDMGTEELKAMVQSLFKGVLTPKFLTKKISSIRSVDDVKHLGSYAYKFIKKLKDFPVYNANTLGSHTHAQ